MAKQSMRIEVNGVEREVPAGHTIENLLDTLELDRRLVVVELNRQIVRRTEIADVALQDGDRLELVHFVGGG
jgi:thiamine biosynthesis protein ThiS